MTLSEILFILSENIHRLPKSSRAEIIILTSIVAQSMLQRWPNRTELRSMDSYIQIFL